MSLQIKLVCKIGEADKDSGVTYTGDFLTALDTFIIDNGVVVMYDENHDVSDRYKKSDFIGIVNSYNLLNNYVILNLDIMNQRFNNLRNLDSFLIGMPRVVGKVVDGIACVEKIECIEVVI